MGRWCAQPRRHVRTGAPDDCPVHLPCDEAAIRAWAFRLPAAELAAQWRVTRRTVVRWRRQIRAG